MQWTDIFHSLIGREGADILWWQMSIRAVLIFIIGLIAIRLFARRAFGEQTPLDIVLAIIVGSNLSRTLTGNAPIFPTLAATTAILVLFWILGRAAARFHPLSRLLKGNPTALVVDGTQDAKAMRSAAVTIGDIEEAARRAGISGLDGVRQAMLERSGKISAIAAARSGHC